MKYETVGAFKNVQNVPYCKAASDMKVGMGVILNRVTETATLPASRDDAKKIVYIVTNISGKPELHNSPETYVVNEDECVRTDDLRIVNGLEIEFVAFEISGGATDLVTKDLSVLGTDGKTVKAASTDGYAVCLKVICKTPYVDDSILTEIVAQ